MSDPIWLTFGFRAVLTFPPGRRRETFLLRDKAPFALPDFPDVPPVARATRFNGKTIEWRKVGRKLYRQILDDADVPVPSLGAFMDLADSGKLREYPIKSDGSAGPGSVLHAPSYDVMRKEGRIVESDRERAMELAAVQVADRVALIGGVPHLVAEAPAWGVVHPLFPGQPARCVLVHDRELPGAPVLTVPIDRSEDALSLGHRLASRFEAKGVTYNVPETQDDMPRMEIMGELPEFDRKMDIARTWERIRRNLADLTLASMSPATIGALRDMDGAHDQMWLADMSYHDAIERMERLLRFLPATVPSNAESYAGGRAILAEMIELHGIVDRFESEYDADDREALGMGMEP